MAGSTSCDKLQGSVLTSDQGYISSTSMVTTQDNPSRCSWTIKVIPGQRINITLFDFSIALGRQDDSGVCLVYAIIKELSDTSEITVCRGMQRQRNVYTSEGNTVEVQVFVDAASAQEGRFLLKYEGKTTTRSLCLPLHNTNCEPLLHVCNIEISAIHTQHRKSLFCTHLLSGCAGSFQRIHFNRYHSPITFINSSSLMHHHISFVIYIYISACLLF